MAFIIGVLTFLLVLDCVALILLVLVQLPKKEAGAGLAFGAGASDALFGAGSGTVLTKVTKYAAVIFFVLAFGLAVLQRHRSQSSITEFERQLSKQGTSQTTTPSSRTPAPAPTPEAPALPTPGTAPATNITMTNLLAVPGITNVPR